MDALALVLISGLCLLAAYFTVGRWLSRRVFQLSDANPTPAVTEEDGVDFVPTRKSIIFGHHFTSIAGTGPIVGPAIAVIWGWLPAILWVVLGSIFIGAVHDLGSIVASLRNKGRSIGDIAGDILGPRARLIFLLILIMGLWIVLAVFGLVIASVLKQYPAAIFPVMFQIPIAVAIGLLIHRKGKSIVPASVIALALMYASVVFGDASFGPTIADLHAFNLWAAAQPIWVWTAFLLIYAYIASVIPVWTLLQPRDYINALQLITSLALILLGLIAAASFGGAPMDDASNIPLPSGERMSTELTGEGSSRPPLSLVAPMINWQPAGAPPIFPLLFITVACGACSGFHCLVGSGTTSKQIRRETDARAVGYGSMLTEGFLATLVIAACAAGIGLGTSTKFGVLPIGLSGIEIPVSNGAQVVVEITDDDEHSRALFYLLDHEYKYAIEQLEASALDYWSQDRTPEDLRNTQMSFLSEFQEQRNAINTQLRNEVGVIHKPWQNTWIKLPEGDGRIVDSWPPTLGLRGTLAYNKQYESWSSSQGLAATVGAFVQGSANFLAALGIPLSSAVALMAVMVASFAATTMDTACRLQRYVIQELARTFLPKAPDICCRHCGYDLSGSLNPLPEGGVGEGSVLRPHSSSTPDAPSPAPAGEVSLWGGEGVTKGVSFTSSPSGRGEGEGSMPSSHSSSTPLHPLPLRERVVAKRPGEGSPESSSSITCPECGRLSTPDDLNHPHLNHRARTALASVFNPFKWLATTHGATIFAVLTAFFLAMGPWPDAQTSYPSTTQKIVDPSGLVSTVTWRMRGPTNPLDLAQQFHSWLADGGKGGLILWPLFGATNQLLAGFAFVVIVAWLRFTKRPWGFAVIPGVFMLCVPAAAMSWQAFIGNEQNPSWLSQDKWLLLSVAGVTLLLEAWLIVETMVHWKKRDSGSSPLRGEGGREAIG